MGVDEELEYGNQRAEKSGDHYSGEHQMESGYFTLAPGQQVRRERGYETKGKSRRLDRKLGEKGYRVGNIDVTVVAERPRLREYIDDMRALLSKTMGIEMDRVSVKASTSNGLGFIGSGQGIAAYAVALIEERENPKS